MKRLHRAVALVVPVLSLSLLAACGSSDSSAGSGSGLQKINFGLVQSQDFIHAMPTLVAEAQGFFTDEGLDVNEVDFSAGSDLAKAMAGGSVDAAEATGLDAVSGAAHQIGVQAFFGTYQKSPMALIVKSDSTIKGFADLAGKKVGISAAGSMTDYILRATLAAAKVDIDSVTEVPLGAPSAQIAALAKGDIDAYLLPINFGLLEQANGTGKIAQTAADVLGDDDQFGVLIADKDYLTNHTDTLKKLTSAYAKAIEWMKNDEDATVKIAVAKLALPEAVAKQTYEAYIDNFTPDGSINAAGLANYAKAIPDLGIAATAPAQSDYLNTSIVSGS